jgi:GMP synthase-like glutamine amidotransferase
VTAARERPWVCLRHVEFEGPGLFETVAREHGVQLRTVATDLGEPVPSALDVGGVIALGGPFAVADAAERSHLADERRLLADAALDGLPVMAICLGAQLLASGLGARVGPAEREERGMDDVVLTPEGAADPVLGPEAPVLRAFQFHGDSFVPPAGSTSLATSAACPHQAFRFGALAYGLQFHIELPDAFAAFIPAPMRPDDAERATLAGLGRRIVDRFFAVAAAAPSPLQEAR